MTFLIITGAISVLTLIMIVLMCIDTVHIFRAKYPDVRIPKSSRASKYESLLQLVIVSIIPIINVILLLMLVFNGDRIKMDIVEKIYEKYSSEEVAE